MQRLYKLRRDVVVWHLASHAGGGGGDLSGSSIHSAFSLQLRGHLIRSRARLCAREADSCLQQRFHGGAERARVAAWRSTTDRPTDRRRAASGFLRTTGASLHQRLDLLHLLSTWMYKMRAEDRS